MRWQSWRLAPMLFAVAMLAVIAALVVLPRREPDRPLSTHALKEPIAHEHAGMPRLRRLRTGLPLQQRAMRRHRRCEAPLGRVLAPAN
jgi:hypothetical protein